MKNLNLKNEVLLIKLNWFHLSLNFGEVVPNTTRDSHINK
jgi:hypothetical protein